MGYEKWNDVGSQALSGAGAGFALAGVPGAIGGGVLGAVGGLLTGTESERRNSLAEKYATMQANDEHAKSLADLGDRKRKTQWQMQFQEAMRGAFLGGSPGVVGGVK